MVATQHETAAGARGAPAPTGRLLEVQRMSTDDGPGIRSTVFFKGCALACTWCQNPESISPEPEIVWHAERCLGCRCCVATCPADARRLGPAGLAVDPERCRACGACAEACPALAAEQLGRVWELDELVAELAKDRVFYEASGGGVTLSGGEPALQPAFARALLVRCAAEGFHTALDTSGACQPAALIGLVEHSRLVLYDLKELDRARHERFTGQPNDLVLANARAVAAAVRAARGTVELWIRTPLVPGATARAEGLRAIGRFLADELGDVVTRWELCAFNPYCASKYRRLGRRYAHDETPPLSAAELGEYAATARQSGFAPERIHATGPTRLDPAGEATSESPPGRQS